MDAVAGFAHGPKAYEADELPLLYPALLKPVKELKFFNYINYYIY